MKQITVLGFLVCLILFGCEKDSNNTMLENEDKLLVIKERNPDYPLILSKKEETTLKSSPILSFDNYLGRSYRADEIPFGLADHMGYPVINIEKLLSDHSGYKTHLSLNSTYANKFSFTNFNRYVEKSKITKKFSTGSSVNLGVLKFGSKTKYESVYSKTKISQSDRIYGQLDILFKSDLYKLQTSSYIKTLIRENYLSSDFVSDLYNTTPVEMFNNYGAFVISKFFTGGRATALYSGLHTENQSVSGKEKNMDTKLEASYKLGKIGGSADVGVGYGYTNGTDNLNKVKEFQMAITTIGGAKVYSQLSPPMNVEDANIDLSPWMNSLEDKSTHALVDIAENGLFPLWDLVLEENIKKQLKACSAGEVLKSNLSEPYIIGIKSKNPRNPITVVLLYTRFNDIITIDYVPSKESFQGNVNNGKYFDIKTVMPSTRELPNHTYFANSMTEETNFVRFSWNKLKKYVDSDGVIYLLDAVSKEGFTLHYDWLLDTYGIRTIVDNMNSVTVTQRNLYDYTLIAL